LCILFYETRGLNMAWFEDASYEDRLIGFEEKTTEI
jgi:hypothetical protein